MEKGTKWKKEEEETVELTAVRSSKFKLNIEHNISIQDHSHKTKRQCSLLRLWNRKFYNWKCGVKGHTHTYQYTECIIPKKKEREPSYRHTEKHFKNMKLRRKWIEGEHEEKKEEEKKNKNERIWSRRHKKNV